MPEQALRTTLQELQIELDKIHFEKEEHKGKVDRSVAEIQRRLRDESFMSGDEFLINELKESLEEFEEDHPKITELIGRMSDLLAKMGL